MKVLKSLQNGRLVFLMAAILVAGVLSAWGLITVAYADEVPTAPYTLDTGYLGFAFGDQVESDHTATRPESKVWWNDGFWWGSLWNDALDEFHIYRLDWGTQTWQDTGVALDDRPESRSDILWDETAQKLYVASYSEKSNPSSVNDPVNWARLYRFTYDEVTESYHLDGGYPVTINEDRTNSLVFDKDSSGGLWATYVSEPERGAGYQVYVNASDSDDENWHTPFSLYDLFPEARVAVDDISSIVSFNNTVGVMWTNQLSGTLNFALHNAGSPMDGGWTHEAISITGQIDDHLSLKANSAGQLFAAIKTSGVISDTGDPLIVMVTRDTSGQFSENTYSLAEDNDTRPTLVIDEDNNQVYVFVTGKPGGSKICYKTATITAPLSNMAFAPGGCGTDFIADDTYDRIDSATTSKHSVNDVTGLVVLASDDHNGNVYVHNVIGNPPPVITHRSPGAGETNVNLNAIVMATFSSNMDPATVTDSNFMLQNSSGSVAGSVSYDADSRTASFAPAALLEADTVYTATVTTGVENTDGTPLYENDTWSFTTGTETVPTVSVAFSAADYTVNEDAGAATITVELSAPSGDDVTVEYATGSGTATVGSDFMATDGTLLFSPGETSETFTVPIIDDALNEPNETVNLVLSNPSGATLGSPSNATIIIVDDDPAPTVQFSAANYTVHEGAGTATITVVLSGPSGQTTSVDYTTGDGSATAGTDYVATSGTLAFGAGETSKTFTVTILDDDLNEGNETIALTLSNPDDVTLGTPSTATLTIVDDEIVDDGDVVIFMPVILRP